MGIPHPAKHHRCSVNSPGKIGLGSKLGASLAIAAN